MGAAPPGRQGSPLKEDNGSWILPWCVETSSSCRGFAGEDLCARQLPSIHRIADQLCSLLIHNGKTNVNFTTGDLKESGKFQRPH